MAFQDESRETEMRELFQLERMDGAGRGDTDAVLKLDEGQIIEFELKSTSRGSVTTVRDFGHEHIAKWRTKHWLIGFYDSNEKLQYCVYANPSHMKPWIDEKASYVQPDFDLAHFVPDLINQSIMHQIVGNKDIYTLEDAKRIHKKQYSIQQYRETMDIPSGYSPSRMLQILKDRCRYVIERGSTLNNPHIPAKHFDSLQKINTNHPVVLRDLVKEYLCALT
jgi:hypothetical protein